MKAQFDIWNADPVQLREHIHALAASHAQLAAALGHLMAMRHKCFIPNEGDWWDEAARAALANARKLTEGRLG